MENAINTDAEGRRQVFFIQLHQELFIPSIGQLSKQLDVSPSSQNKQRGLKMWLSPLGIEVDLRGRRGVVPMANVAVCIFTPTPSKDDAAKLDKGVPKGNEGALPQNSKLGTATVSSK